MDSELESLDIFDLISERHIRLRKQLEHFWNEQSPIQISNSEWFIIARIYQNKHTTISSLSKQVDITRQATHKFIKRLEEKGLVAIENWEGNKKMKKIKLTPLGIQCYKKTESLKKDLEMSIIEKVGEENMESLRRILQSDWGF